MECVSKKLDAIIHFGGCLLLSSFIVDNAIFKTVGLVCSTLLIIPSVVYRIVVMFKNKEFNTEVTTRLYWLGFYFIIAALLYHNGYNMAALVFADLGLADGVAVMLKIMAGRREK